MQSRSSTKKLAINADTAIVIAPAFVTHGVRR